MKNKANLLKTAILNSAGILAYTLIVALIIQNGEKLFGKMSNTLSVMSFLMLFVLSAAIVGSLIIAKPIMLYLDGAKKEALRLLIYTIGALFIMTLLVLLLILIL